MTLRILALTLLTALANAQHPKPGAEPKPPAAKRTPDARPDVDVARARRLLALADLDGDGVISPRERQWVHRVLEGGKHEPRLDDDRLDDDRVDEGRVDARERERVRRAKEHADEVQRANSERREEARRRDAKKPPPAPVKR